MVKGYMGWDKSIDFNVAYNMILKHMKRSKQLHKCYDSILLIQLRNGSRVSEAVRAYLEYVKTGKSELEVAVSKKRRAERRLMVIPDEVVACEELIPVSEDNLVNRVKTYAIRTFKINTHSLRYAFITYLLKQGVNPAIIAKITRHSKLDYIIAYTQKKAAEDVLREL